MPKKSRPCANATVTPQPLGRLGAPPPSPKVQNSALELAFHSR